MKITLNWIKDFIKIDKLDAEDISEKLTMSGSEVKKIEFYGERFKKIIIGRIISFEKHPNADKLSVCKVDNGSEILNIVCGANNFKNDDRVALAVAGAEVSGHKIKRSKIRGMVSEGMMCSEKELGISQESEGIMILDESYEVGKDFAQSLGFEDQVIELEITPNRPDCMSIIGMAREIAALTGEKLVLPGYDVLNELNKDKGFDIEIKDYSICTRYSAKVFSNISKKDTPEWMKSRLIMCDVRPKDLIVDLTNYVMIETGQPLHAFDIDKLSSRKIIVRKSLKKEKIKTIDGISRKLEKNMIVISDEKQAVALAGIMGGKETEISSTTKNVLLESANFNGPIIMKTSKDQGLRTEASNRFEKRIDPELTVFAIKRFEELLEGISGHREKAVIYDNYKEGARTREIKVRKAQVEKILGISPDIKDISRMMSDLEIENSIEKDQVKAIVPSFRYEDLEREIDLIEEIARMYGYNNIESEPPAIMQKKGGYTDYQKIVKRIRQTLADSGISEVINYSFISNKELSDTNINRVDEYKDGVKLINPINEDFSILRTTLLQSMLKNIANNMKYNINDVAIFEIAKTFLNITGSKLPSEKNKLGIMLSGRVNQKSWNENERNFDYYDLKGLVEFITHRFFKKEEIGFTEKEYMFFHPRISADIMLKEHNIGFIGKIHPSISEKYDIGQDIFYTEINLDTFNLLTDKEFKYNKIPLFPSIDMDIAISIDEDIDNEDVISVIRESGSKILKKVRLFDIYKGKQLETGKKSMAYSMTFQADDRTLKDREVEIEIERMLEKLRKKFNAKLREQ